MADLWGIDCVGKNCFHDTSKGYRLRFKIRRDIMCPLCRKEGLKLAEVRDPWGHVHKGRRACATCKDGRGNQVQWRNDWVTERRDLMFRTGELLVAQSQMKLLGCTKELEPNKAHLIEQHDSLPMGFDARMLILTEEPMPRCAVYFRWNPEAGQMLTPDCVFQCKFPPNATAAERRGAPEVKLSVDQFREITQLCLNSTGDLQTEVVETYTSLKCQHCGQPISARAFSTQSLREVSPGE